ncbi:AraC-like DNA-binding protein [Rhizomicrobium palustre]|jgi:AraC-like DNA-binding protein|uniref:AraC-like DNA-binding protein n=2 Tax=Rhizomicrobium palustre TaxID=189966 RepID=A0A846MVD9_9PROT|nr:AraC-like DNA-binding protein [Rhizomicrobium palustre]
MSGVFRPMMCMVLQGAKEASIGGKTVHYDEACYLVATMELAGRGRVIRASLERPYLCVALSIDLEGLASLLPAVPVKEEGQQPAFAVNPVTDDLIAAWGRLLGLLDTPEDIPVLAPLIEREILYRLLQGPQGAVLRQAAFAGSHHAQVRRAMLWLKEHYAEPMRIDDLAEMAGMSPASFHRHFKAAAAMSPLQYQKALRLQEARRLLASNADAARTAFAVGYESPSQFSREYARAFGLPPARDAQRLKGVRMEDAV